MNNAGTQSALLAASLVAAALAGIRWLRVAQREHYLPGSVLRFAGRWWSLGPNRLLAAAAVVGLAAAAMKVTPAGLVAAAAVACGPFGLTLRGRTSQLAWTRRLKTVAGTAGGLAAVLVVLAAVGGGLALTAAVATLVAVATPLLVDAALAITAPVERRLANKYVDRASAKLTSVRPTVVAVTGSYGKTGTKGYIAHLLEGKYAVLATPASFNNRAGLARAINEHLAPGIDVFVAEMGTYGPGEIAEMCSWVRPDIAVITAVGPVHLERMGSEERIAAAKAEILDGAEVAVLNIDSPHLAAIADRLNETHPTVRHLWRCSAVDRRADVCVLDDGGTLRVFARTSNAGTSSGRGDGHEIARASGLDAPATNVACAVAVALELGVGTDAIAARLVDLPTAPHRRELITHRSGATVIDDTYNANPAGATAALNLLAKLSGDRAGRRIVVTPGMVELGNRQADENAKLAEAAARIATDLVVVGQTNAPALLAGAARVAGGDTNGAVARAPGPRVVRVATRQQAVAWVSEHAGSDDAVLYENDLPDHFP